MTLWCEFIPSSRHRLSPCRRKLSLASRVCLEGKSLPRLKSRCRSAAPESSQWGTGTAGFLRRSETEGEGGRKSQTITALMKARRSTGGEFCGDGGRVLSSSFGPELQRIRGSRMESSQVVLR